MMIDTCCPWCETTLSVEFDAQSEEQSCPECLTSWTYDLAETEEVALAA